MKAIVCHGFGPIDQLRYEEVADPQPGPGEVLLRVRTASVNYPDALLVQGLYQMKPELPFIPGAEVAGEVVEVGENVSHLSVGDRVMSFCMLGGFAEKIAIDATQVMALPDEISFEYGSVLSCVYGTSHYALKQRGSLQPGETLVVLGAAGGTGLAAVQIGKAMGARVIAVCSTDEKLALAAESGADILVNSERDDLRQKIKEATGGKGADVVYDPVGGELFDICSRSMAWNGRLLVIGFTSQTIPQLPVNLPLVKGYSVVGVFWGTFTQKEPELYRQNLDELLEWIKQGKVRPVIDKCLPISSAVEALHIVTKRQVKGKIVLVP